jgi:hypothetical protein
LVKSTNLKGFELFHRGCQTKAITGFREEQDSWICRFGKFIPFLEKTRGGSLEVRSDVGDRKGVDQERPGKDGKYVELVNPRLGGTRDKGTVNFVEGG